MTTKRGRPDLGLDFKMLINVGRKMLEAIDEYRRSQPDIPNRSAAVRDLLKFAILEKMGIKL